MIALPNLQRIIDSRPLQTKRRPIPDSWARRDGGPFGLEGYKNADGLRVLLSVDTIEGGRRWLHVSCSRPGQLPTWEDLRLVKDIFIGRNHEAVQVLPKDEDYVNLMPFCLHLWSPEP